jgi:hypothetical protein
MALFVSVMGGLLIHHYNRRLNKARDRAVKLAEWLSAHVIDPYTTMGETSLIDPEKKDIHERLSFYLGMAGSWIIVLISVSLVRGSA